MSSAHEPHEGPGLRLLHVECDRLLRVGLRGAVPPGWYVTSVRAFDESGRLAAGGPWDACLLGIGDQPGALREALACLLLLGRIGCPLLVWISMDAAQYVPAVKALGVTGFVSRSASFEELHAAIVDVARGGVFIDHRLCARLPSHPLGADSLDLTDLQRRVAGLYVLHGNRRLVARDLHVSENTIKYHLRRIYAKTGLSSVHELHQLLLSFGWTPPE